MIGGNEWLEDRVVELALNVAELVQRIAFDEGLAAVDVADVIIRPWRLRRGRRCSSTSSNPSASMRAQTVQRGSVGRPTHR